MSVRVAREEIGFDKVKLLVYYLDGERKAFNIDWVPEDKLDWFIEVISRHLYEVFEAGQKYQKGKIKVAFNTFLHSIDV